jgi:hypothetical protein
MKSKFLLVLGSLVVASFVSAHEATKPGDKPAPEKKEVAKDSCNDDSCCDPKAEAKKEEAKPAPAAEPKK